jgi:hypothetical protein
MSLAASGEGSVANIAPDSSVPSSSLIAFGDEEIADVSLATFHVFDNENFAKPKSPLVQVAWRRGCGCGHGCRGCGRGCGWGGCRGCGGCGWAFCISRGGCHAC